MLVITTVRDERGLRLLILLFLGAIGLYMAHSHAGIRQRTLRVAHGHPPA